MPKNAEAFLKKIILQFAFFAFFLCFPSVFYVISALFVHFLGFFHHFLPQFRFSGIEFFRWCFSSFISQSVEVFEDEKKWAMYLHTSEFAADYRPSEKSSREVEFPRTSYFLGEKKGAQSENISIYINIQKCSRFFTHSLITSSN